MRVSVLFTLFLSTAFLLTACNVKVGEQKDDNGRGNNKPTNPNRINWSAIPSDYNPSIEEFPFNIDGVERIQMDIFGFKNDVELIYSRDLPQGEGRLLLFKVWNESASWGSPQPTKNGKNLALKNYGTYQCSIKTHNGNITALKGGCYVRIQVILPANSEVELYNVGELISKRFIPIDTDAFLKNFMDARWIEEKFASIEDFLNSYVGTSKKPTLDCNQLGMVIDGFSKSDEQFRALRRLHTYVTDRENLGKMIEDEFSYFDRDEARNIVGI